MPGDAFTADPATHEAPPAGHDVLLDVVNELRRSVELRIVRDIRFDVDKGALSFVEDFPDVRLNAGPNAGPNAGRHHGPDAGTHHELSIHPADRPFFLLARSGDAKTVEYRIAGAEVLECFLLTLGPTTGGYAWARGTIIKLRQPQRLRDLFVRQARLVDLGSMVSAISHEIKQPLFTIAMAAESIRIILRKPGEPQTPHIERCAARITAQVDRARGIIRRILQYGRTSSTMPDRSAPAIALEMCHAFMLPLIDERGITVVMNVADNLPDVAITQLALEQILVNAVQNAVDSIESARTAGRAAGVLELYAYIDNDGVRCGVRDDGMGLEKDLELLAFDAFFTTKPVDEGSGMGLFISRQIINEAAGTIALKANAVAGAALDLWLPRFMDQPVPTNAN